MKLIPKCSMYCKQYFHIKIKTFLYKIQSIFKFFCLTLFDSTNIRLLSKRFYCLSVWFKDDQTLVKIYVAVCSHQC